MKETALETTIHGVKTYYERQGGGKPVLILHGWGASIEAVRPIVDHIVRLGYEAVAVDLPGFGKSGEPDAPWGVEEYGAFVRGFMEEAGILGCDCIGHSHGGRIILYLASQDKTLFKRLVLVDAAGVRSKRGIKYHCKVYAYKLMKRLARIKLFDRAFGLSQKQKNAGSADYRAASGVMRQTLVRLVNTDLSDRLERVENETLLIWGENDTATPLYMGELMQKRMKNAGLAVIPDAGHFSYADDYPRFCAILSAYFKDR